MFWIELLIVLVMIFIGTRKGGPFMALAGGIGMFILTFFLHVSPSDPPITVIRIMIAVILAASAMQAAGGLDYMVRLAEKILRKHPCSGHRLHLHLYVRHRSHRLQPAAGHQ